MKKLIERFKAELPCFWKCVQKLALSVGGSMAALLAGNSAFDLQLNDVLLTIIKYSLAVCITIAGTAQFTKQ